MWPFVVLWLRGGALRGAFAVLFFAALAGRFVAAQLSDNPYLLNATLFSELDAIAVGAFLAAWLDAKPDLAVVRKVAWAALGVGGLAVVGIIGFPGGHWAVVQLTAFAVFFGGALWLAVLAPPIRALRFGPLVRLGKVSYGVYLYHPLIFFLVEKGLKGRLEQPALM